MEEQKQEIFELGVDYYIDQERFVWTAHYLSKRGYCCKNGCRHCPYGFKKADNQTQANIPLKENNG
jgi:hypothetical protein